ncbi:XapX domain-containing protein [Roseateles sp.]|uniref:XapX domain-containing protein n=1 Tax=Roseateles sp. TaxID=1971397 RepID=UPI0031D31861
MNAYVLSAAVGLLVGVLYGVFNVRSPAPPVIALVGLLGILAGEQIPGLVRQWMHRDNATPAHVSWLEQKVRPHMFGRMPGCNEAGTGPASSATATATATTATSTNTPAAAAPVETKDV